MASAPRRPRWPNTSPGTLAVGVRGGFRQAELLLSLGFAKQESPVEDGREDQPQKLQRHLSPFLQVWEKATYGQETRCKTTNVLDPQRTLGLKNEDGTVRPSILSLCVTNTTPPKRPR